MPLKNSGVARPQVERRVVAKDKRLGGDRAGIFFIPVPQRGEIVAPEPTKYSAAEFFCEIDFGEGRSTHGIPLVGVHRPIGRRGVVVEPPEIGIGGPKERIGPNGKGVVDVDVDRGCIDGDEAIARPFLSGIRQFDAVIPALGNGLQ